MTWEDAAHRIAQVVRIAVERPVSSPLPWIGHSLAHR